MKEMQVEGSNLRGAGTLQWGRVLTTWREEEPQKAREVGRPDLGAGRGRTQGGTTVRISTAAHRRMDDKFRDRSNFRGQEFHDPWLTSRL